MKTTYLFLFTYLVTSLHFGHLAAVPHKEDQLQKHWQSTGINIKKIKKIAFKQCHKNQQKFMGCIYLLNTLLESMTPSQVLVPLERKEKLNSSSQFGFPTRFSASKIIPRPQISEEESLHSIKQSYEQLRTLNKIWKTQFALGIQQKNLHMILQTIYQNVLKNRTDKHKLMGQALSSYYEALFFDNSGLIPESLDQELSQPTQQFAGIGIEFRKAEKGIQILTVFPKGPAAKAQLKPYDIITYVNGRSIRHLEDDEIVSLLTGPIKSKVSIEVLRPYKKVSSALAFKNYVTNLVLTREQVVIERVRYKKVVWKNQQEQVPMGYIQIDSFGFEGLAKIVKKKIRQAQKDHVEGLILDLSNNYGGYVDEALQVLELFISPEKPLLIEKPLQSFNVVQYISQQKPVTEMKLVVIINSQSASASEIVAGVLKHHKRALLVGDTSFGKGTVQTLSPYPELANTIIKKTTDIYLLPSGKSIHTKGVQPHLQALDRLPDRQFITEHLRLRDYSQNPVMVLHDKAQPKIKLPSRIASCLLQNQKAKLDFLKQNTLYSHDYRFLVAKDVLACDVMTDLRIAKNKKPLWKNGQIKSHQVTATRIQN